MSVKGVSEVHISDFVFRPVIGTPRNSRIVNCAMFGHKMRRFVFCSICTRCGFVEWVF